MTLLFVGPADEFRVPQKNLNGVRSVRDTTLVSDYWTFVVVAHLLVSQPFAAFVSSCVPSGSSREVLDKVSRTWPATVRVLVGGDAAEVEALFRLGLIHEAVLNIRDPRAVVALLDRWRSVR